MCYIFFPKITAPTMNLSEQQVLALAPDSSSANNGKKLAQAKNWANLGQNVRALWGECQGSGAKPYQVRVDLADFASKCSCPSFKFPCKHALGLLVLTANDPSLLSGNDEPDWVAEWLDKRSQSAATKEAKALAKAAAPVDERAQQKRAEKRDQRVRDGLAGFQLWMEDVVRNGLARLAGDGPGVWAQQAARLVDAQAPTLATRLAPIGDCVGTGDDWPQQVLAALGKLALAVRAYEQLDLLPRELQQDVRQLIGFTLREDEVLAAGISVRDRWQIVGQTVDAEQRIAVQRTWLIGEASGKQALLLQFSANGLPFGATWLAGTAFEAELAYWPGAHPQRALLKGAPSPLPASNRFTHTESVMTLLDRMSAAWANNPWLERVPAIITGAVPVPGQCWHLLDAEGHALPLAGQDHWLWLSLTGGAPHPVAIEWDGKLAYPLGLFVDDHYQRLNGGSHA